MAESKDDLAARKARADRLEAEIAERAAAKPAAPPAGPASPRDFIQQRMAELDAEEKAKRKGKPKK